MDEEHLGLLLLEQVPAAHELVVVGGQGTDLGRAGELVGPDHPVAVALSPHDVAQPLQRRHHRRGDQAPAEEHDEHRQERACGDHGDHDPHRRPRLGPGHLATLVDRVVEAPVDGREVGEPLVREVLCGLARRLRLDPGRLGRGSGVEPGTHRLALGLDQRGIPAPVRVVDLVAAQRGAQLDHGRGDDGLRRGVAVGGAGPAHALVPGRLGLRHGQQDLAVGLVRRAEGQGQLPHVALLGLCHEQHGPHE